VYHLNSFEQAYPFGSEFVCRGMAGFYAPSILL